MKYLSSLKNKNLSDKICLLRVDFNIQNTDLHACPPKPWRRRGYEHGLTRIPPFRISAILPTIQFLLNRKAKVVILSHRGRPVKVQSSKLKVKSLSLKPFAKILSNLLNKPVNFIDFENGFNAPKIHKTITASRDKIFLLENLRFLPGEEKNDVKFAKKLASLGNFYVNDAFSVSHRKNASIVAITKFLPSYPGFCLEKEIKNLSKAIKNPKKPLIIILGGAKISDKIGVIKNFMKGPTRLRKSSGEASKFLIGGAVANTFFSAKKLDIGNSVYEKNMIPLAQQLLKSPPSTRKIILPIDWLTEKGKILDIGPKTSNLYAEIIKNAKTIIWNGPMGYFENPKFIKGTEAIIEAVIKSRAFSIVGGGETTAEVQSSKLKVKSLKHIFLSTGGGAMLEYLSGKKLPGIEALKISA